jgi:chromosome segregation ATPase
MTALSNELSTAEIAAAEWRAKVGKIKAAMAAARSVLNSSDARRGRFALDAATGNAEAAQAMAKIRRENESAEKDLADLQLALPEAQRNLAEAEQTESAARKALAKQVAQAAMRKRIAAAAKIDAALAQFVRDVSEWENLGEIVRDYFGDLYAGQIQISTLENVTGFNRLLAALPPPIFGKLFPSVPRGTPSSLAASESDLWSLPEPEQKAKATA